MLFLRKRKSKLNDIDIEKLRRPLPGLRTQETNAPSLHGVMGDAQDGLRHWSQQKPAKEEERVFPWEVPTRGEYQWE